MKVTTLILDNINESTTKDKPDLVRWKEQVSKNTVEQQYNTLSKLYKKLDNYKKGFDDGNFRELYNKITFLEGLLGTSRTRLILH